MNAGPDHSLRLLNVWITIGREAEEEGKRTGHFGARLGGLLRVDWDGSGDGGSPDAVVAGAGFTAQGRIIRWDSQWALQALFGEEAGRPEEVPGPKVPVGRGVEQ